MFYSIVAERSFEPSAKARARADEIIAASDKWEKARERKKPCCLLAAERNRDKTLERLMRLEEQIAETPAASIERMVAKARCVHAYSKDCQPETDDPLSIISASIVRDLLAAGGVKLSET